MVAAEVVCGFVIAGLDPAIHHSEEDGSPDPAKPAR
jgi:hypothetical protein